jgi:hypothetical protein
MIQSRGGRHWCPLFGSEHVHGSRSSGRAVGTAAGASARSARMTRASRLKRAFARVSRNAPSWSRTGTPRRLFPRARTPTRPPRGPPRCGPWTPQPRSRRARDPSRRPRRARREERRDAPEDTPRGVDAAPNEVRAISAGVPRSERRKATKKRGCEFSSSAWRSEDSPEPALGGFRPVSKSGTVEPCFSVFSHCMCDGRTKIPGDYLVMLT